MAALHCLHAGNSRVSTAAHSTAHSVPSPLHHVQLLRHPPPLLSLASGTLGKPFSSQPAVIQTFTATCGTPASRAHCRRAWRLIPASSISPSAPCSVQPDLVLENKDTGTVINVFGVEHMRPQPHIGEYIIASQPDAVVVETAVGPEHGALPGNVLTCGDQVVDSNAAFYLRMFCQVAASLRELKSDFRTSPLWQQVAGSYNGEQLAYIGAFTAGVPLVYGDRPKDITFRRLYNLTTLAQLDEAFDWQAAATYRDLLGVPHPQYDLDAVPHAERILMQEREAVMLCIISQLCHCTLPQGRLTSPPRSLVLVAGADHLPGLHALWDSGRWRELAGWTDSLAKQGAPNGLLHAPAAESAEASDQRPDTGVRRGLMDALLRLSVTQEVLEDVSRTLGPIPPRHQPAATAVGEIYNSPRMALAALPQPLLEKAVQGYQCNFHQVLDNMRAIRPMHGGPGYSEEMVTFVRALNFELD